MLQIVTLRIQGSDKTEMRSQEFTVYYEFIKNYDSRGRLVETNYGPNPDCYGR
jgi:hypothetical protein